MRRFLCCCLFVNAILQGCASYSYLGVSGNDLTYISVTTFASDRILENFHLRTDQTSREVTAGHISSNESTGAKAVGSAAGTIAGAAIRAVITP